MTHILIPREPSPALLRPFVSCPQEELPQAYAAMIRIAEVERARAGSQCLAQIEEPAGAAPAAVAPQGVVAWMHPETLNVISAAHKHDMSTEYGAETRRKAESHSVALVRAGEPAVAAPALEAPPAVAPQGEYPHEQMDAMALARYKVVPSHASMLWSHAVVAGDGAQQLYVGREVECQNMARKFAGAFLDGAFAFHSMAAAPTAQAAPALEAPAAPAIAEALDRMDQLLNPANGLLTIGDTSATLCASRDDMRTIRAALAAAPQAPAAPAEGEVLVEVIGLTGSGKSAICGEIEILCRALGLDVSWPDGDPEKNMTHAEWTAAIEAYKPRVRIVERNVPRQSNGGPAK